jgi:pimeloyl-ACP methyl ester carboxylesterase
MKSALDSSTSSLRVASVNDGRGGTTPVAVGPFDIQLLVASTLGDRKQMAMLPQFLGAAARGNFAPFAMMKAAAARQGINSAFEALMDCQTGIAPARLGRVTGERSRSLFGRATLDFPEHCAGWGVGVLPASFREPVRTGVPVLLISGTLDGRTPVLNASEAQAHLSRSTHLVIEGASHGDDLFLSSPDIVRTLLRFLAGDSSLEPIVRLTAN